jgi:transcriptional regulator with XRE-family HTH domain
MADPQPPPEAELIARYRETAPRKSIRQAAVEAGISDTRWRQIETGRRTFRGQAFPETAPPEILARMAQAVGVPPAELEEAGRADAAAELLALAPRREPREATQAQLDEIINRVGDLIDERVRRILDERDNRNGDDEPRRAS